MLLLLLSELYHKMEGIISRDPEILNGTPVFSGTRVPVKNLFDYIESGETISSFLEDFPSVDKQKVDKILSIAEELFSSTDKLNNEK